MLFLILRFFPLEAEMIDLRHLQTEWLSLINDAVPEISQDEANHMFDQIVEHYMEPWRFYHTLKHISEMLARVQSLPNHTYDSTLVKLAIWFHDVIYIPARQDNEEESVNFTRKQLVSLNLAPFQIEEVIRLIMLTKNHTTSDIDMNGMVMMDADLAILGSKKERYEEYMQEIRKEYSYLSDQDFYLGRLAFLQNLLARPQLFNLNFFRHAYEGQARNNIKFEMQVIYSYINYTVCK